MCFMNILCNGETVLYISYLNYLHLCYVYHTVSMNRGIIITLHKGGKKLKNDPNNYRAITLSPTMLKIYENILLLRSKANILSNLNIQQGGFQENLGCSMTSFSLKECILYGKEDKSKVFACFLDARQAFDRVCHNGLFYKLHASGIDMHTFLAFVDIYSNMQSCVRNQQLMSSWFNILQGTRQGGKSSPLLYLLFIDGLIKELEKSGYGLCIYDTKFGSPTVADDMVLVSFSKLGLDSMLEICKSYY